MAPAATTAPLPIRIPIDNVASLPIQTSCPITGYGFPALVFQRYGLTPSCIMNSLTRGLVGLNVMSDVVTRSMGWLESRKVSPLEIEQYRPTRMVSCRGE